MMAFTEGAQILEKENTWILVTGILLVGRMLNLFWLTWNNMKHSLFSATSEHSFFQFVLYFYALFVDIFFMFFDLFASIQVQK